MRKKYPFDLEPKTAVATVPKNGNGHNGNGKDSGKNGGPLDLNEAFALNAERQRRINEVLIKAMEAEGNTSPKVEFPWLGKIKHPGKRAFLAIYGRTGNMTFACKMSGVTRNTARGWAINDLEFKAIFENDAKEAACDYLEKEAWRRATEGTMKPQYHQGKVCGFTREFSDTLLIFLLKGNRPEKFRENVFLPGAGGPVEINIVYKDTGGGN